MLGASCSRLGRSDCSFAARAGARDADDERAAVEPAHSVHGRTTLAISKPAAAVLTGERRPGNGLRSLFLVGAPRCGTSSLAKALACHPQICFSSPKETYYFLRASGERSAAEIWTEFRDSYFRALTDRHRIIADGTVAYLYAPEAIERILRFDPAAHLLIMLRDPLEMLPSYHARLLYTLDEDEPNFRRAWDLQGARRRGERLPRRCRDPRLLSYDEAGRFSAHLERLFEVAGRERCLVLLFDDLAADPIGVYRDVLAFAGLDDDGRMTMPRHRSNRSFRYGWLQPWLVNPPAPITRLLGSHAGSGYAYLHAWTRPLRRRLKRINAMRMDRPPLDDTTRHMLRDFYATDVAKLADLLGRDLSHWLGR
jgi:hypothetical protein